MTSKTNRRLLTVIVGLGYVVMLLAGQWAYVFYKVLSSGDYLMHEPQLGILVTELVLALGMVVGAAVVIVISLRRVNDD